MGDQRKNQPPKQSQEAHADSSMPRLWKPRERKRDDLSKRKLQDYDHGVKWSKLPKPDDQDLVRTLEEMGEEFVLHKNERQKLLELFDIVVVTVSCSIGHKNDQPPNSELAERYSSKAKAAERLYDLFDVGKDVRSAFVKGVEPFEIHTFLCDDLVKAAIRSPEFLEGNGLEDGEIENIAKKMEPLIKSGNITPDAIGKLSLSIRARELIAAAVYGVAALAVLTRAAAERCKEPVDKRWSRIELHSILMAGLYREMFGKEPTKSNGSPWVKFLAWGRIWAQLPPLSDDRLRRLPIRRSNALG